MIADLVERVGAACALGLAPGVLDVERGAVVDEPRAGGARRACSRCAASGRRWSRARRTRPRRRRARRPAAGRRPGRRRGRPGRKSRPRLMPGDRSSSSWISSSGSAAPKAGSTWTSTSSGTGRPSARRELPGDELGDERLGTLAGAGELEHVHAVVVGLDERRQRPALAERRQVARRDDGAKRLERKGRGRVHRRERTGGAGATRALARRTHPRRAVRRPRARLRACGAAAPRSRFSATMNKWQVVIDKEQMGITNDSAMHEVARQHGTRRAVELSGLLWRADRHQAPLSQLLHGAGGRVHGRSPGAVRRRQRSAGAGAPVEPARMCSS